MKKETTTTDLKEMEDSIHINTTDHREMFKGIAESAIPAVKSLEKLLTNPTVENIDFDRIEREINHIRKCTMWMNDHKKELRTHISITVQAKKSETDVEDFVQETYKGRYPKVLTISELHTMSYPSAISKIVWIELDKEVKDEENKSKI